VSCLGPLLAGYAPRVTAELAPYLHGPFGGMVRRYLPQRWVLEVGPERYTIAVETDGSCTIRAEPAPAPDVIVTVEHDRLRAALERRPAPAGAATPIGLAFPTAKGETAFRFLRSRFGL
jgi:hypothetical protein